MTSQPKKIALILSSVRAIRVGPSVVDFIKETFKKSAAYPSAEITLIDIASFNLPVYNEKAAPAMVPAYAQFEYEHSKAWSAAIAPYDGYVFVTPEYNGGVPGGVKNAIDYLYNEWIGKPILIISYGIYGGSVANLNLKYTFEVMKLRVLPTRPTLPFPGGPYGPNVKGAMLSGTLTEETKQEWEKNTEVLKGFEELLEFINDPAKKGTDDVLKLIQK